MADANYRFLDGNHHFCFYGIYFYVRGLDIEDIIVYNVIDSDHNHSNSPLKEHNVCYNTTY